MSVSIIAAVERAIAAALTGTGQPCVIDRSYPGEYIEGLSINLVALGWNEDKKQGDHDSVSIVADWALMIHTRTTFGTPIAEALDVLVVWAWFSLYADLTLGGNVEELSISKGAYQYDPKDVNVAQCQIDISARYDVNRGDLTANYNVEE